MSFTRLLLPLMALTGFTACFEKEVGCDDYAAASAQITVLDESGAPVTTATVIASTEDGELDCETWDENGVYVCGYEVSGPFLISIEAEGFEPQELELEVGVTEDECHVVTEMATVTLVAVAP